MSAHPSNSILNSLPLQLSAFRSKLNAVSLPVGMSVYEAHETPKFAHFLTSGIASVVTTMRDGGSVETGMWASEGLVECMHLAGSDRIPSRCFMQMGGTALRMAFADLERDVENLEPLRAAIHRSIQTQALILGQLVACNRLHEVEERLARWLLMLQDRTRGDELLITQEFLAEMLGSRRTTVTLAAGALQRIGLIEYQRGRVHILDRERLESAACECYPVIRKLSGSLIG
ncbi:MAG TPA: Crp/Fnr family transcriptional regulator [Acidobacteriaceae bacterium]|nr:Crp/Fnr family transcriptional regulator [Acidobacteriaceae bacterium]